VDDKLSYADALAGASRFDLADIQIGACLQLKLILLFFFSGEA